MLKITKDRPREPQYLVTNTENSRQVWMHSYLVELLVTQTLVELGDKVTDGLKELQMRNIETQGDTFGQAGFVSVPKKPYKLLLGRDEAGQYLIGSMLYIDPDDGQYVFAVTQEELDDMLEPIKTQGESHE